MPGNPSSRARLLALLAAVGCRAEPQPPPPPSTPTPGPPAPATGASPSPWVISAERAGPVTIGWTVAQLNAALADSVRPSYQISDECDIVHPTAFPAGLDLMVVLDTVVRVDVDSAGYPTVEGVAVGDSETVALRRYQGRVTVQPHKYSGPQWHNLVATVPADPTLRIIFETDGVVVKNYRAGRVPAVEYVEGCA